MAELTTEQVRSLDQTRQRLLALHTSLTALRSDLSNPQQPLPSWSSFQSHASLISNNLQQISGQLSEHQHLLDTTVAFPLPHFPARSQDAILQALLRTNLEPDVKEWIEQGQTSAEAGSNASYGDTLSESDRRSLWQWAPSAANAEARKQKWGADYTLAEKQTGIESVITGLQRPLVEPADDEGDEDDEDDFEEGSEVDDDDDEEEEEDAMDVDALPKPATAPSQASTVRITALAPQMPLESVHKFMTTGR